MWLEGFKLLMLIKINLRTTKNVQQATARRNIDVSDIRGVVNQLKGCGLSFQGSVSCTNRSVLDLGEEQPLLERLKVRARENFDPLPIQLLRKYICR